MVQTYLLTSLAEAVDVATTLTRSWFRGHSTVVGELTPRLFRPENWDQMRLAFQPQLEMVTVETFKRHAEMLTDVRMPSESDRLGWLCLMQHYKTPTRLLDWAENLLVALFFAIAEHHEHDAELWAMLPWALNKLAGAGWGIPLAASPWVKYLLEQPYWGASADDLARSLKLRRPVASPLAIEPPLRFPRMVSQASTFTLHPTPTDGARSILDALPERKHLVRYIIPAAAKPDILKGLRALGVTRRHLFPELEGLSDMIVADNAVVAYSPPDPPSCSGEVPEQPA